MRLKKINVSLEWEITTNYNLKTEQYNEHHKQKSNMLFLKIN